MRASLCLLVLALGCSGESFRDPELDEGGAGLVGTSGSSAAGSIAEPVSGAAGSMVEPTAGTGGNATVGTGGSSAGTGGSSAGQSTAGAGAGSGGSSAGTGGSSAGGAVPKPFACPDPEPDDAIEWEFYTVEPGRCAILGSASWSGENVCRETSTTDGECDAKCTNYLSVHVGMFDEPVTIAVLPLFGQVVEYESSAPACAQAAPGITP